MAVATEGMSRTDIERAQNASYGYICEDKSIVCGEYTGHGFVFKDAFAFMAKADTVCYIPQSSSDELDDIAREEQICSSKDNEYWLSACKGYTYQDILDICGGDERIAEECFFNAKGQTSEFHYQNRGRLGNREAISLVELLTGAREAIEDCRQRFSSDFERPVEVR